MVGPSQGNTKGSKKVQVLKNRLNSNRILGHANAFAVLAIRQ